MRAIWMWIRPCIIMCLGGLCILSMGFLSGCATLILSPQQIVEVGTNKPLKLKVQGRSYRFKKPGAHLVVVDRKSKSFLGELKCPGGKSKSVTFNSRMNMEYIFGNIFFGPPGYVVDAWTGTGWSVTSPMLIHC